MLKPSRALRLHATLSRSAKPPPTHFTSARPHAFSPISPSANAARRDTIVDAKGAPAGETPRQRVERLRKAALQARLAELPWQERMIVSSRRWLDFIHRGFSLVLISFSVILILFVTYSFYDMIMFNRRRKSEYYDARQKRNQDALSTAVKAVAEGKATLKQKILIKRYEAVQAAEDERLANRGFLARSMDWALPGTLGRQSEAKLIMKLDQDIVKALETGELKLSEDDLVDDMAAPDPSSPTAIPAAGGPLDQQAQAIADNTAQATKSWTSWILRR